MNSTSLVIVAIPEEQDPTWLVSSQPIPHLTLLYLGDASNVGDISSIVEYVEHAATTSLTRFSLDVDRRGTLGDDEADVVFFKGWDLPDLKLFRSYLLKNDNIAKAYNAVAQFPEWEPHLTLGYPDKPAAKPKGLYERVSWVHFDRVAVWIGDFEGPEFQLRDRYDLAEVAMSDTKSEVGETFVKEFMAHYGVKGMRWGHRKDNSPQPVEVSTKLRRSGRTAIKTSGGKRQPVTEEALKSRVATQKIKKSGIDSLSNKELADLKQRLNLEKEVSKLAKDRTTAKGRKALEALLELQGI